MTKEMDPRRRNLYILFPLHLCFFFLKQQLQITATLNYYVSIDGFLGNSLFWQPSLDIKGKVKMKTTQVLLWRKLCCRTLLTFPSWLMHLFWNNQLLKFNKSKLSWDMFGYNVFFKTTRGLLIDQLKAAEGHLSTKILGQLVDVLRKQSRQWWCWRINPLLMF